MSDSKRLAALKALTAHLEGEMTAANDYTFDLTGAVFRGRYKFAEGDPDTMLSILENFEPDRFPRRAGGDEEAPTQKEDWIILLQGWTVDDSAHPTDRLYEFMAETKKALAKLVQENRFTGEGEHANYMLGGLINGLTMEPGTVRPFVEQASDTCCFYLRVVLKFVENPNDPFNHE